MRTSIRADSLCSPADLLYGSPLRLPGDMFEPSDPVPLASDFASRLRTVLGSANPMPVVHHGVPPSRIDPALKTASHVFLRVDAVRRPLIPPFLGPFAVLTRDSKTFDILQNGKTVKVSIDRLKPAFLTDSFGSQPQPIRVPAVAPPSSTPTSAPMPPPTPVPPYADAPLPRPVSSRSGRVSRPVLRFQA